MASTLPPRAVLVTRPTELEALVLRHGTLPQARFQLKSHGLDTVALEARHEKQEATVREVLNHVPMTWRRARVSRESLDRFLFEPEDLIVAVGQDGLVANVAKYLSGQPVFGVNSLPDVYEGVLVRHRAVAAPDIFADFSARRLKTESRTMVEARLADGQSILALNEIFIGHRSHQSARYVIGHDGHTERHSSSGIIVSTGTGATGWAKSVCRGREGAPVLPAPGDRTLAFFVREAWASRATGATITDGLLSDAAALTVTSEMNDGGGLFGDGVEDDRLDFPWSQKATIRCADGALLLV